MNTPPPTRPRVLVAESLARAGFSHGFSTRDGGVSAGPYATLSFGPGDARANVEENLALFARDVPFDPASLRQVTQVHGARVVDAATLQSASAREEADALVLRPDGVSQGARAVGVRVADCVPVLVGARSSGAVAAIHAGWRGVVAGVIAATLGTLGGRDEERVAAIGPCIGPCCFEVGAEVATQIAGACGDARVVARREGDKAYVDLRRAVRAQLAALGITDVEDVPGCTKCDGARFFSHRRDGEPSGRHLAVIALRV